MEWLTFPSSSSNCPSRNVQGGPVRKMFRSVTSQCSGSVLSCRFRLFTSSSTKLLLGDLLQSELLYFDNIHDVYRFSYRFVKGLRNFLNPLFIGENINAASNVCSWSYGSHSRLVILQSQFNHAVL
jgi:hypothetical protein